MEESKEDEKQGETSGEIVQNNPDTSKHTLLGILSYLGILVIIPFLVGKDMPFVKFHVKQGLVLLCISIIVWILQGVLSGIWMLLNIVNLGIFVLAVIGIVNVIKHKEQELPWVGSWASYFKF